jgi:hypothetical protein
MELITTSINNKNFFERRPILKPSPIPIKFISFNNNEDKCDCGSRYSGTPIFNQKYCKNCLSEYIKNITNSNTHNIYLDVHINTNSIEILYFKQLITNYLFYSFHSEKNCKLCEKGMDQHNLLCSDCYQISYDWIKSTFVEQPILIINLPWWDAYNQCITCNSRLEFKLNLLCSNQFYSNFKRIKNSLEENNFFHSNCKKWCPNCFIIYTGCRYCLTTNIIFGLTDQSQCKKCKRTLFINIDKNNVNEFLSFTKTNKNYDNHYQIANYLNNIDKISNPLEIYKFIKNLNFHSLRTSMKLISDYQIKNLENNENSTNLDKPFTFIPFNNNEDKCHYCNDIYSTTYLFGQKYCKNCLSVYIEQNIDSNIDKHISINNFQCKRKHSTQNIQEWHKGYLEILYFKQIITNQLCYLDFFYQRNCKLCEQLIYKQIYSTYYLVTIELIKSTLTKKTIPIIYLPWWDAYDRCIACDLLLESIPDCQKWCPNCFIIYIGCRYCLTTNIILGFTNQSRCKKCERITIITIDISGNHNIDEFLHNTKLNINNNYQITTRIKTNNPLSIYNLIKDKINYFSSKLKIGWIPYSQIKSLEKIAEGGFGIIYKALINEKIVAIKGFLNSQDPSSHFLNEVSKFIDSKFYFKYYLFK